MSYPPIDHLNQPPHPFWDFVAEMNAAYQPPGTQQPRAAEGGTSANAGTNPNTSNNANEQGQQQQSNVEDPPEVDPATVRGCRDRRHEQGRGRRRCGSNSDEENDRRREWCGRRGWGRRGWGGAPGPFGPGFPFAGGFGGPRWGRGPPPPPGPPPPGPPPPGEGFGPVDHGHRGPGHHRGGPFQHHHVRHHQHGFGPRHPHGPRGPSPPPPPPGSNNGGFDLNNFLTDLGARIGIDLSAAAANLGLTNPTSSDNVEVDFEPKSDIFDLPTQYIIHLSLPGARKSDLGVDWDGEHSALRVAGVVYRPDVDENMLSHLVVDGRKRETGVFEKLIRLGTRREPAVVDVAGITAKMRDGVLVITVPKGEKRHERREVPIAKSNTPSPVRAEELMNFDNDRDHDMAGTENHNLATGPIQIVDRTVTNNNNNTDNQPATPIAATTENKGKQTEYKNEKAEYQSRESTIEAEPTRTEQLPAYKPVDHRRNRDVDDWENFESDGEDGGEGEYVKINVD